MVYYSRNFDDGLDYYYMEFKEGEAFKHFSMRKIIDPSTLKSIRNPESNVFLALNNSHEAFLSVVDPIYYYLVIGHNIPAEKIVLFTGSFDILDQIKVISEKYNKPALKAEIDMVFENNANLFFNVTNDSDKWSPPNTLVDKQYEKKFLNFNRRWRIHRPTFVMLLVARNLLNKGYVSLGKSDQYSDWYQAWQSIIDMNYGFPQIVKLAQDCKEELLNIPDLYLDTNDLVTNRAEITFDTNCYYENSLFSLVSETHYYMCHAGYEPTRFLSEKAWKPILFKHPFIMISTPGILSCLKQLGYQTFDGVIDESYDKINNDGDRMLAIVDETRRLCEMNPAQQTEFINKSREVCEYNFKVLTSKTNFYHKVNY